MTPNGVGLGFRPELAADIFRSPHEVDFVEVVAETCFAQPLARREAMALAEIWPVIPHGVKLSLGSADGVDVEKAARLGDLARDLRAPVVTEHVAMTRGGGRDIGHLTAIPFTREAVSVVARNVAAARRRLPDVPFLLENIAWSLRWPEDLMDEGSFYEEIVRATGCDLLLDVANLYANALNSGVSPEALLATYPLEHVAMIHVAGGAMHHGFYEDTHAHAVPPAVFGLLARVLERTGPLPMILERDAGFPPWEETSGELAALRALQATAQKRDGGSAQRDEPVGGDLNEGLAARQAGLARILTGETSADGGQPYETNAVARTRRILQQKRLDDALPLLPRVALAGDTLRTHALAAILRSPRTEEATGIADARHLADVLAEDAAFAAPARLDRLELRSRFDASNRSRVLPFFGRERLPSKGSVWAFKGPGRAARTHFLEWRTPWNTH